MKTHNVCNGVAYEIVSLDDDTMTVKDGETEIRVTYEFNKKAFRLAFARTFFSVQSQTLRGSIAVHDMEHPVTTNKHLLTAVSRGTSAELFCLK